MVEVEVVVDFVGDLFPGFDESHEFVSKGDSVGFEHDAVFG